MLWMDGCALFLCCLGIVQLTIIKRILIYAEERWQWWVSPCLLLTAKERASSTSATPSCHLHDRCLWATQLLRLLALRSPPAIQGPSREAQVRTRETVLDEECSCKAKKTLGYIYAAWYILCLVFQRCFLNVYTLLFCVQNIGVCPIMVNQ